MKRILALMFAIAFAIGLWAQDHDYLPFFEDGKVWEAELYDNGWSNIFYTDSVCGDTKFQGKDCKVVRHTDKWGTMDIIVYENNRKTFYYDENFERFLPMMDFNLQVGDYAQMISEDGSYTDSIQVSFIKTVTVRGINRKMIKVGYMTWVEGVYASGILVAYPIVARSFSPISRGISPIPSGDFLECRKDGKVLCTREDLGLKPLGIKDIVVEEKVEGPIYDTMGRRVETPQPGRLYIRNGHKFIAKP